MRKQGQELKKEEEEEEEHTRKGNTYQEEIGLASCSYREQIVPLS
jgi:hypothetical protein